MFSYDFLTYGMVGVTTVVLAIVTLLEDRSIEERSIEEENKSIEEEKTSMEEEKDTFPKDNKSILDNNKSIEKEKSLQDNKMMGTDYSPIKGGRRRKRKTVKSYKKK
jgi:hypothetical protein